MAYVKTTWKTGDVITAEKLNNIEGGIEAASPVVLSATGEITGSNTDYDFNITKEEIFNIVVSGTPVILAFVNDNGTDYSIATGAHYVPEDPEHSEPAWYSIVYPDPYPGDWTVVEGDDFIVRYQAGNS